MGDSSDSGAAWRILVVDDRADFAEVVRGMASLFTAETRLATSLSAALRTVRSWQPHIIVLDLHLPADQWEPHPVLANKYNPTQKSLAFCELITSHPQLQQVTVCMVSVDNQPQQIALAKQAGAHFFVSKGDFSVESLERIMQRARDCYPPAP